MTEYHETDFSWLERIDPQPHVAGGAPARRGWLEAERVIVDHELVLFEGARFRLRLPTALVTLDAPAYVIVPPGTRHVSWNGAAAAGFRRWVHFDWSPVGPPPARLFTYLLARPDASAFRLAPDWVPGGLLHGGLADPAAVFERHARLVGLLAGGPAERIRARAVLLELLLWLLLPPAAPRAAHPAADLASRVRALLTDEASRPIRRMRRLDELLRGTGVSYEHACRVFRRHGGLSPHAYVMQLRIERAKLLLLERREGIRAVAKAVGFDSHAHFSHVFRRLTGLQPSAFNAEPTPRSPR